jgi:hypothetical protein
LLLGGELVGRLLLGGGELDTGRARGQGVEQPGLPGDQPARGEEERHREQDFFRVSAGAAAHGGSLAADGVEARVVDQRPGHVVSPGGRRVRRRP